MSDLQILKAVCEIRYPTAGLLFDNRGKVATRWQGESGLTEWQIGHNHVVVHAKDNMTYLQMGLRSAVSIMETPDRFNDFCYLTTDFLTDVLGTLKLKKVDRIGVRFHLGAERKIFKQLVNRMKKSLFSLSDDDWELLGGLPEDIGFPITLKFDDRKAFFKIGPMEKAQLETYFRSDEVKEGLPATVIFVDMDVYKTDVKLPSRSQKELLREYIETSWGLIQKTSNQFLERYGGFQ